MVHLAAIVGAIWFWSWGGVALALGSYFARMVVVTDAYVFGRRRYETSDDSRNSFLLALATTGEGWHNHHHHYPSSARQGFRWWEIDVTYYVLWLLARFAIVWDLRPPPSGG